jgi:tetrapyrrole methylase family protein/MazG family protein
MTKQESNGITLLGLGPGSPGELTRQAWDLLTEAAEIYLRTSLHPVVPHLPPNLEIKSFDHLYDTLDTFDTVYEAIVDQVLDLGSRPEGVVYGVPGHPFVAEATGPEIYKRARAKGIPIRVIAGLSFLEPTFAALCLDPFPQISLVDALGLVVSHHPGFPPNEPALIAQLYSRQVAGEVKLTLMAVYPDDHPVRLIHGAGTVDELIEDLALYEIDRSPHIGLLTSLLLPPLGSYTSFESFQEVIAHLRAPEGCPWDREQTHLSLRPYLLEETYEALAALDAEDPNELMEELGDLLIQIVLHAQIATENGDFNMADILQYVTQKLIYRHPHVFGEVDVSGSGEVKENWEKLKAQERQSKGNSTPSALDGVPDILPALAQADAFQQRANRVGFDWPEVSGVIEKVLEELEEVRAAEDPDRKASELGDLLFSVVNLARWSNIDPETALREAN